MDPAHIELKRQALDGQFAPQRERFNVERVIGHGAEGITFLVTESGTPRLIPPILPEAPGPRGMKRLRSLTPPNIMRAVSRSFRDLRILKRRRLGGSRSPDAPPAFDRSPSPPAREVLRRLCVKMPHAENSYEGLRNEIAILRNINGSVHVVGLIAYRDDPEALAQTLSRRPFPRVPPEQGDFLAGMSGPLLVTEFLENGTLARLIQRVVDRDVVVPNRILWAFYLCGVRACIALAYPKASYPGTAGVVEEIPGAAAGVEAYNLVHCDIYTDNVVIGNIDPAVGEHSRVPVMKLIDFGNTATDEPAEDAILYNLCGISEMIYCLIVRRTRAWVIGEERFSTWQGIENTARELTDIPRLEGPIDPYGHVDMELRDLLCRSMARDWDNRPLLPVVLGRARNAVANKTAASFALSGTAETDDDIRQFVQQMILDAD
ncbi:hypothetical protein F5Y16DRAFT_402254 [Xylariaceae sp. FL0255]|nr:hypothetical protein F5Y16DRAFT_402254 [Xylariaceae sp. FL0255]